MGKLFRIPASLNHYRRFVKRGVRTIVNKQEFHNGQALLYSYIIIEDSGRIRRWRTGLCGARPQRNAAVAAPSLRDFALGLLAPAGRHPSNPLRDK
jgi:hypothetical protein